MTKIREATEEDVFDILVLAREFSKESPITHKWNKEKTEQFLISAINNSNTIIFVLEENNEILGAIIGLLSELFMSQTILATEVAWFVNKNHRGKKGSLLLMKTFENLAKQNNADYTCMSDIDGITSLENFYLRKGYSKCETTYMKEV